MNISNQELERLVNFQISKYIELNQEFEQACRSAIEERKKLQIRADFFEGYIEVHCGKTWDEDELKEDIGEDGMPFKKSDFRYSDGTKVAE